MDDCLLYNKHVGATATGGFVPYETYYNNIKGGTIFITSSNTNFAFPFKEYSNKIYFDKEFFKYFTEPKQNDIYPDIVIEDIL